MSSTTDEWDAYRMKAAHYLTFLYWMCVRKRKHTFEISIHYNDVTISPMASQITGGSIVYSTVCSGPDQRKHQSSVSLAYVTGLHPWPVYSPHKEKCPHLMTSSWYSDIKEGVSEIPLCARKDPFILHSQYNCSLQWRHNERDGVSNHQPHHCLLNRLFTAQFKENIEAPRHWPLWREFTGDRWIPHIKGQ